MDAKNLELVRTLKLNLKKRAYLYLDCLDPVGTAFMGLTHKKGLLFQKEIQIFMQSYGQGRIAVRDTDSG